MDLDFIREEAIELCYTPYCNSREDDIRRIFKKESKNYCRYKKTNVHSRIHFHIQRKGEKKYNDSAHWESSIRTKCIYWSLGSKFYDEIANFLKTLSKAIRKYGWSMVFNMDETSVRINNGNDKTIDPTGTEEIIIISEKDNKECFTAIGTC